MTKPHAFAVQTPQWAVSARQLTKIYQTRNNQSLALDHIDLGIPCGSIFGLLGPNGAGKSTLINILAGLVFKTSGTVEVWGIDIDRDSRNARAVIGVVPQELNIDPYFTPLELLDMQAGLYGLARDQERSLRILDLVGLGDKATAYARHLSGGMRRRLMVAKAMIHDPPILVLDEPTAGVDVDLRRQLWTNVRALNDRGITILLTTHYLEEAQELCDHIAIIDQGRLVACEEKNLLLQRISQKELTLSVDRPVSGPVHFGSLVAQVAGEHSLSIRYNPQKTDFKTIMDAVQKEGYGILDVHTDEADLEDIFLELTSHKDTVTS